MQQRRVQLCLWAEAVATSVYIHNRMLDKQSPEMTAYEAIFQRKPSLAHVRVFGCTAYAHVPEQKRTVWAAKGKKYKLVGYDSHSRNYRLYDPTTRGIIIARNVSFDETPELPDEAQWNIASDSDDDSQHSDLDSDNEDADGGEDSDDKENQEDENWNSFQDCENPIDQRNPEDDPDKTLVAEPQPPQPLPQSPPPKEVKIRIRTKDGGEYVATVPTDKPATVEVPSTSTTGKPVAGKPPPASGSTEKPSKDKTPPREEKSKWALRRRSKLHQPARFQSNSAMAIIEPCTYKEAMSSPHSQQ